MRSILIGIFAIGYFSIVGVLCVQIVMLAAEIGYSMLERTDWIILAVGSLTMALALDNTRATRNKGP